eukprot:3752807-Alexandrium_andersonii.AAC.1
MPGPRPATAGQRRVRAVCCAACPRMRALSSRCPWQSSCDGRWPQRHFQPLCLRWCLVLRPPPAMPLSCM